jgi:hypothetical protein
MLLCYHGSPNSVEDRILFSNPAEELDRMLAGHHGVLCGRQQRCACSPVWLWA